MGRLNFRQPAGPPSPAEHAGTAGTANTGGGGGGGGTGAVATGAGGSGVVILSVPTTNFSNTYANATVTTSGSNTIITFTTSGTYTG